MRKHYAGLLLSLLATAALAQDDSCTSGPHYVGPNKPLEFEVADGALWAAWNGEALQPVTGPLLSPAEGVSLLAVAAVTDDGFRSPVCWNEIVVDNTPPEVLSRFEPEPIDDGKGSAWLPDGAVLFVDLVDDLAGGASMSLRSGIHSVASADGHLEHVLPSAGELQWSVRAEDRVGNSVTVSLQPVSIDSEPPSIEWIWDGFHRPHQKGWLVGPETGLAVQADDAGSGIPSDHETFGPWSFAEGSLDPIRVRYLDRVGNVGRLESGPIVVDRDPPNITWSILDEPVRGLDGADYYGPEVTVEVTVTDELSGLETLRFDMQDIDVDQSIAETRRWSFLASGGSAQLFAKDAAGNSTEIDVLWQTDLDPPVLSMICNGEEVGFDQEIVTDSGCRIDVSDAASGVASWSWSRRGSDTVHTVPELRLPDRGRFHVSGTAVDLVGNKAVRDWILIVRAP